MTRNCPEILLTNAKVVLADDVIEAGWVAVVGGQVTEIGEGTAPGRGEDFGGDLLLPGLIELHTDHLEAHVNPRPKVEWDGIAAVIAYDGQIASSVITKVLDSLRVWNEPGIEDVASQAGALSEAISAARTANLLRADHLLHLRCEVPMPDVVTQTAKLIERPDVRLMSLMDHTPGQRQFRDESKFRTYYRGKRGGLTDAELDRMCEQRIRFRDKYATENYRELVALARKQGKAIASHDDTTPEHVEQSISDRVAIAEFPTTIEAAISLHEAGVRVLMGAPNLVRGGSHSGNIATADLARAGMLDILSSDYIPASLLLASLRLPQAVPSITLPEAIRTVTKTPAEAVGLNDRGEIAVGKRADLIRISTVGTAVAVRSVWREGRRVA